MKHNLMNENVSGELAREMYRKMRRIRRFEEYVVNLVNTNEVAGVTHEYVGEEAVAVGVCSALRGTDIITSTHRGHGHLIAKGGETHRMLAELMGRETGCNKGRGGSMHIADVSVGTYGANGIVGAGAPMACGAAYTFKVRNEDRIAVAFFGDGAINQGVLHEALNLASIWTLPVVFVCENNLYAITTPIGSVSQMEIHRRAEAYGMPTSVLDGMDVEAVYTAALQAVAHARGGNGPTFLECRTYRFFGHHTAERMLNLTYRTPEEVAAWRERDPLELWGARLARVGMLSASDRAAVDAEVDAELEAGLEFARESPWPDPAAAFDYMYAISYPGLPAEGWE